MCGIAGVVRLTANAVDYQSILCGLSRTLRHRGPDDEGYLTVDTAGRVHQFAGDDTPPDVRRSQLLFCPKRAIAQCDSSSLRVGLVHRRLSIVDLTAAGHQPYSCVVNQQFYSISFNGEIYNHTEIRSDLEREGVQFETQTDTEVLLKGYIKWGVQVLSRLNGMWAFALYDATRQTLFCARDRNGVKPFYYTNMGNYWAFASEQKALLALPQFRKKINEQAVFDYLAMGRTEATVEGMIHGITELPAAHFLLYQLQNNSIDIQNYYHLNYNKTYSYYNKNQFDDNVATVRELVLAAVQRRLQAAVPVAASLSGGIDSSALVGMATTLEQQQTAPEHRLQVFTSCFAGSRIDETAWAAKVVQAQMGAVRWHQVHPTADDLIANIETLTYANDEPSMATNTYSHFALMRAVQQSGVKIILEGQGADEVFGGYFPHYAASLADGLRNLDLHTLVGNITGKRHYGFANPTEAVKFMLKNMGTYLFSGEYKRLLKANSVEYRLLRPDFWSRNAHRLDFLIDENPLHLNELLHRQFTGTTLKVLLRSGDRNSMHHSIEARMPFTDDRPLIEAVMAMPAAHKIRNGKSKLLLREAMKDFLPEPVYNRTDKVGFATPEQAWLMQYDTAFKAYITPDLNEFLDTKTLLKNWDTMVRNAPNGDTRKLWRIINLGIWRKVFDV